ncbi:MAG: glycosyltransferase family 4 protein [Parcubacteria group bacterium]|nr:glycosyltransferase family 4 protein [Parcubacteria group bacterium]
MQKNKHKTKILYVITKSNFGGAQRYVYDLATSLPREDFDVAVALGGDGLLKQKLDEAGVRTVSMPSLQRDIRVAKELKTLWRLFLLIRRERPRVLHLNSSKAGALGVLAARLHNMTAQDRELKTKIIFTAHGWAFNEDRPWWQKECFLVLYWLIVLLSHRTVAVSQAAKDQVAHLPFIGKKIIVIHNGVSAEKMLERAAARRALARRAGIPEAEAENALWIGTVAELHKTKGLNCALEAIRLLGAARKKIIYAVLGEGEERRALEELIKIHGLEDRVYLPGFIPNAAACLSAFDIFTLPSVSEALAYAVLEAGSAGLPVVATKVGGIPEIITHEENGLLVPPREPLRLAHALGILMEDAEKRERFGARLKEKVESSFAKEKMLRETSVLYSARF